tara:strand:- start:2439 stop:2651 length:213 start_codon:yes stop_codon:yes gene_type:complete
MTNKKLRRKARKNKDISLQEISLIKKINNSNIVNTKPLKQLGDLSRTSKKKSKDKIRKNNREFKLIQLGM